MAEDDITIERGDPWPPRLPYGPPDRRTARGAYDPPARLGLGRAPATVPAPQQRAAIRALGLDALDAQIRQVVFFDTPDLAPTEAGVVVRARRIQGRVGDSVIKLRPLDPDQVSRDVRRLSGFGVEVDAIPGGFVCSGRLKCRADPDAIHKVVLGERPAQALHQGAACPVPGPRSRGDRAGRSRRAGPIFVLKLKWQPRDLGARWSRRCGSTRTATASSSSRPMPALGGVPGRGRGAGLPQRARDRPLRRAADQDTHRAGVLRGELAAD